MLSNPRILKSFLLTNILVVRRQITAQVVIKKWFVCGKWFIGYNFGLDDGPESKTGTHKELIAFKILKYKYCVNQSRDMPLDGLLHLTILRKIVNYCSIGGWFNIHVIHIKYFKHFTFAMTVNGPSRKNYEEKHHFNAQI